MEFYLCALSLFDGILHDESFLPRYSKNCLRKIFTLISFKTELFLVPYPTDPTCLMPFHNLLHLSATYNDTKSSPASRRAHRFLLVSSFPSKGWGAVLGKEKPFCEAKESEARVTSWMGKIVWEISSKGISHPSPDQGADLRRIQLEKVVRCRGNFLEVWNCERSKGKVYLLEQFSEKSRCVNSIWILEFELLTATSVDEESKKNSDNLGWHFDLDSIEFPENWTR